MCSDRFSFSPSDENKIKFLNGEAFQNLKKLTQVSLAANDCINENFKDPTEIAAMLQIVTQKCGFNETANQLVDKDLGGPEMIVEKQQNVMNETILEKENWQSEINVLNVSQTNEIVKLIKQTQDRCDSQYVLFKDLSDKLEKQFNETLSEKTQHCIETVLLKLSDIDDLLAELIRKNEELNVKDHKIKNLEERIKILGGHNNW